MWLEKVGWAYWQSCDCTVNNGSLCDTEGWRPLGHSISFIVNVVKTQPPRTYYTYTAQTLCAIKLCSYFQSISFGAVSVRCVERRTPDLSPPHLVDP